MFTYRLTYKKKAGFTLLELVYTLALVSLLLGVGIPGLSNMLESSRKKNITYSLVGLLNFARNSAVSLSSSVVICPSQNLKSCSRNWNDPLLIFVDRNKNNQIDEAETALRIFELVTAGQSLSWKSFGRKPYLSFDANGTTGFQSGRIYYCSNKAGKANSRAQVVVYRTGRVRIASSIELRRTC